MQGAMSVIWTDTVHLRSTIASLAQAIVARGHQVPNHSHALHALVRCIARIRAVRHSEPSAWRCWHLHTQ